MTDWSRALVTKYIWRRKPFLGATSEFTFYCVSTHTDKIWYTGWGGPVQTQFFSQEVTNMAFSDGKSSLRKALGIAIAIANIFILINNTLTDQLQLSWILFWHCCAFLVCIVDWSQLTDKFLGDAFKTFNYILWKQTNKIDDCISLFRALGALEANTY